MVKKLQIQLKQCSIVLLLDIARCHPEDVTVFFLCHLMSYSLYILELQGALLQTSITAVVCRVGEHRHRLAHRCKQEDEKDEDERERECLLHIYSTKLTTCRRAVQSLDDVAVFLDMYTTKFSHVRYLVAALNYTTK